MQISYKQISCKKLQATVRVLWLVCFCALTACDSEEKSKAVEPSTLKGAPTFRIDSKTSEKKISDIRQWIQQNSLGKITIRIVDTTKITDKDISVFSGVDELWMGRLKITDKALENFSARRIVLDDCPLITASSLLKVKNLKDLYLWKMPQISHKDLARLREKGIKVFDGRHMKYSNID